jgi:hydroxymethylbilane synthase
MEGLVASLDGRTVLRDRIGGTPDQAEEIGVSLAERLLSMGARDILKAIYGTTEK